MYPLVAEFAADGVAVTVSCRVLKLARQPYYRWLKFPITGSKWFRRIARMRCSTHTRMTEEFGHWVPGRRSPSGR